MWLNINCAVPFDSDIVGKILKSNTLTFFAPSFAFSFRPRTDNTTNLVMFVCARVACVCVFKQHAVQLAVTDEKKQNKTREPQSNRLVRLDDIEQLDAEMRLGRKPSSKIRRRKKKKKRSQTLLFFIPT